MLWMDDLAPYGGTTLTPAAELAQRIAHRLQTRRGALLIDPSYGIDIAGYLGSQNAAATIQADVLAEARREPGAEDARITIAEVSAERISIQIDVADASVTVTTPLPSGPILGPGLP